MTIRPGSIVYQDVEELIVRQFDWTDWLQELSASAQLASSTFEVDGGDGLLTLDQASIVTGNLKTQFRISGGTKGKTYRIRNEVVSNETPPQTGKRSFYVTIKDR